MSVQAIFMRMDQYFSAKSVNIYSTIAYSASNCCGTSSVALTKEQEGYRNSADFQSNFRIIAENVKKTRTILFGLEYYKICSHVRLGGVGRGVGVV